MAGDPDVILLSPSNNEKVRGTTLLSAFATSGSGISFVQFKLGITEVGTPIGSEPYEYFFDTTEFPDGSYALSAVAQNGLGGQESSPSRTIIIDNTSPVCAFSSPANGANVSGILPIIVTCSDNLTNVVGLQLKVNGENFGAEITGLNLTGQTFNLNTLLLGNGAKTIEVVARDGAGNLGTTGTRTINVNNMITIDRSTTVYAIGTPIIFTATGVVGEVFWRKLSGAGTFSARSGNQITFTPSSIDDPLIVRAFSNPYTGADTDIGDTKQGCILQYDGFWKVIDADNNAGFDVLLAAVLNNKGDHYEMRGVGVDGVRLNCKDASLVNFFTNEKGANDAVRLYLFNTPSNWACQYRESNVVTGGTGSQGPKTQPYRASISIPNNLALNTLIPPPEMGNDSWSGLIAGNSYGITGYEQAEITVEVAEPVTGGYINCGGSAIGPFEDDRDFTGGTSVTLSSSSLQYEPNISDLSALETQVIKTARKVTSGNLIYNLNGFTPNAWVNITTVHATDDVRMDFNIFGNNKKMAFQGFGNYDGSNRAVKAQNFWCQADSSGNIELKFTVVQAGAMVSAIVYTVGTPPVEDHTKQILIVGDSINGFPSQNKSVGQLLAEAVNANYYNFNSCQNFNPSRTTKIVDLWVSGEGVSQAASQAPTEVQPRFIDGIENLIILQMGSNSLGLGATGLFDALASLKDTYIGYGFDDVLPCTVLPRVGAQSAVVAFNSKLRTDLNTEFNVLIDFNKGTTGDANGVGSEWLTAPSTYFRDSGEYGGTEGLHPSFVGHQLMANIAEDLLFPSNFPTVNITGPTVNQIVKDTINLTANAADDGSIASVQFKIDGVNVGAADTVSPFSVAIDTNTLTNGVHSVTAVATDNLGNQTTSSAINFTVDNQDPTGSFTSPANNALVKATINVVLNEADNDQVASVQLRVDGVNVGSPVTSSPFDIPLNTSLLTNAVHALTAIITDRAGNALTTSAININVDNSNPTGTVTSPTSGQNVSGTVNLTGTFADNIQVQSVQWQIDNENFGSPVTVSPFSKSLDTTTLTNGSHSARAIVNDTVGNSITISAVSFTVNNTTEGGGGGGDTENPTVAITSPANNANVSGNSNIVVTSADDVGVVGLQLKVDGANVGAEYTNGGNPITSHTFVLNTLVLNNGSRAVTVTARDQSGKTTTSAVRNINVNNVGNGTIGIKFTQPLNIPGIPTSVIPSGILTIPIGIYGGTMVNNTRLVARINKPTHPTSPNTVQYLVFPIASYQAPLPSAKQHDRWICYRKNNEIKGYAELAELIDFTV